MTKGLCNQMYIALVRDDVHFSDAVILKNILKYHLLLKLLSGAQNISFYIQWWKIFTLQCRVGFWK